MSFHYSENILFVQNHRELIIVCNKILIGKCRAVVKFIYGKIQIGLILLADYSSTKKYLLSIALAT